MTALAALLIVRAAFAMGRARPAVPAYYSNANQNQRMQQALEIAHESLVIEKAIRPGDPLAPFVFQDALETDGTNFLAADARLGCDKTAPLVGDGVCQTVKRGFENTVGMFPRLKALISEVSRIASLDSPSKWLLDRLSSDVAEIAALRERLIEAYPPEWSDRIYRLTYEWVFPAPELLAIPGGALILSGSFEPTRLITPQYSWMRGSGGIDLDAFRFTTRSPPTREDPVAALVGPAFDRISLVHPISAADACLGDIRIEVRGVFRYTYRAADGSVNTSRREVILYGDNRHGTLERN